MMQATKAEEGRAIRKSYSYGQDLADIAASLFPDGNTVQLRDEIIWMSEELTDDPEERAELLPYIEFGLQKGIIDRLLMGEDKYEL